MRKFIDILTESTLEEAPISDITHYGDWDKNSSFKDQDRKLLTNPKAVAKMKAMWKYPEEVNYNILLVNNAEANRFAEIGIVGDVGGKGDAWLQKYMPKTAEELISNLKSDEVNIIFTNNKGAERVPMTGWIMAHRFGHVLNRTTMGDAESFYFQEAVTTLARYLASLAECYNIPLNGIGYGRRDHNALFSTNIRKLVCAIGKSKAARDGNLRTTYEFVYELFAQYIINGRITFNPVPEKAKVGRTNYSIGDDADRANSLLIDCGDELESYFSTAAYHAVGMVLVM